MQTILFLAHNDTPEGLSQTSRESLTAAINLQKSIPGARLMVGLVGISLHDAANGIGDCGAERYLGVEGPEFSQPRYSSDAAAAEAIMRESGAQLIIAPSNSRWSRVLPGVAQRLGGRADTHVTDISVQEDQPTLTRWLYRQRIEVNMTRTHRPWIIQVDTGTQNVWTGGSKSVNLEILHISLPDSDQKTQVTGVQAPPEEEQTIRPDAQLLFVAGAGWTKKQPDGEAKPKAAEEHIRKFLHHARASLGSSKSLVDLSGEGQDVLSMLTHLNQVGQTGSTPRHPKGLATCCHGEEPHVVGWRFINQRRAINLDPNCGWAHGKADILYVADAFEVMQEVNQLLSSS